jgi:outer membrane protein OmpA-like peptidoglycan-associated protein
VLNLFNSAWGVSKYLNPAIGSEARILKYEGVDAEGFATFSTPEAISGKTETFIPYKNLGQCWYASVGLKYLFEGKRADDCGCDDSDAKEKTVFVKDTKEIDRLNGEINRLRAQVNDLENRKPEKEIVTVDNSRVVTFPYLVNFTVNTADVVNREKVNLETVAKMIKATPEKKYSVTGYADKQTGTVEGNAKLANNRSQNVYDILINQYGVPASQLVRDSKGGVDYMYMNDEQLSRSVIISEVK